MRLVILISLLAIVLLAWLVCPFQPVVVAGASMEPTLHDHQLVLINRNAYRGFSPERGDIVVFREGGELLIKRVHATGGDSVLEGLKLEPVHSPNGNGFWDRVRITRQIRRIPAGYIYVLGDGLSSCDSREFGPVPVSAVIGKVVLPSLPSTPAFRVGYVWR